MVARASTYLRTRIVKLREQEGLSYNKIRKKLLIENTSISVNSVAKICQKYKKTQSITDKKRSGRRKIFSLTVSRYIDKLITSNREINIEQLQKKVLSEFNIRASRSTVSRTARLLSWKKTGTR